MTSESILHRVINIIDLLDVACKKGEIDDNDLDEAQKVVTEADIKFQEYEELADKLYIVHEAQGLIHWIRGDQTNAKSLLLSAANLKGELFLYTESGSELLNRFAVTQTNENKRRHVALISIIASFIVLWCIFNISIPPYRAFGGAVWLNGGPHYISDAEISDRIKQINAPGEAKMADSISKSTVSCDAVESGFCQQSPNTYVFKSLITPAVAYQPGSPDTQKIVGYCTLCNDGSFSPSCAVGRGACSHHGGVAAYDVGEYVAVRGTPEVPAKPAVYSYTPKTFEGSPSYIKAGIPTLDAIANFKQ